MTPFVPLMAAALALAPLAALAQPDLPPLKPQHGPQLVVDEHLDALNKCDWNRLMAQYPPEVEFHLPNGVVIKGREKIGELFTGFCKTRAEGGFRGLIFRSVHVFTVGDTVNVTWEATADFLREPYRGADAYVTQHGLMYAQVTTFDPAGMKLK
jgi:predicted SnoaL-like aldol condensation-catalyzing enzyme